MIRIPSDLKVSFLWVLCCGCDRSVHHLDRKLLMAFLSIQVFISCGINRHVKVRIRKGCKLA